MRYSLILGMMILFSSCSGRVFEGRSGRYYEMEREDLSVISQKAEMDRVVGREKYAQEEDNS